MYVIFLKMFGQVVLELNKTIGSWKNASWFVIKKNVAFILVKQVYINLSGIYR